MLIISRIKKAAVIQSLLFFISANILSAHAKDNSEFIFKLSPSVDYIFYREFSDSDETLNTETGFLPGINFTITFSVLNNVTFFSQGYYGSGIIYYDGELQNGQPYETDSKMVKNSYRFGGYYKNLKKGFGFFIAHDEWDRHILSRNGVPTLSEYYSWDSLGITSYLVVNDQKFEFELARLLNAGLKVDLTEQDYGVVPVSMPNGYSASISIEQDFGASLPGWRLGTKLKSDYFPRGEATINNGLGLTEPENISIHLSIYLSKYFNL